MDRKATTQPIGRKSDAESPPGAPITAPATGQGIWAWIAPAAVLLAAAVATAALLRGLLAATGGRFVYVLDDAYIHLSMARTFAEHGVWGLHPAQFANASSSPLWTLLLSGVFRASGPSEIVPLLLNLIAGAGLLWLAYRTVRRWGGRTAAAAAAMFLVAFWTPVPAIVFTGQEHLLHALLSVAFLGALMDAATAPSRRPAALWILAALLPAARVEGLFLAGSGAAALALRRRWGAAAGVVVCAAVPLCVLAVVSLAHGGLLLPNPVLLKGAELDFGTPRALYDFAVRWYRQAVTEPSVLALLIASATWLAGARRGPAPEQRIEVGARVAVGVFASTLLLHLQLARLGWFYRYEAYLIALGVVALACGAAARVSRLRSSEAASVTAGTGAPTLGRDLAHRAPSADTRRRLPTRPGIGLAALVFLLLLGGAALSDRAAEALSQVHRAARNIWMQQVQMATFLGEHYPGAVVAANDMGAITWYARVDPVDLWGLASPRVARARHEGTWDRDAIDRLTQERRPRIAILYEAWFEPGDFGGIRRGRPGGLPASWTPIASWTAPDRVVLGHDTVTFFALDPAEAAPLAERLRAWSARLPPGVVVRSADPAR